MARALITGGAGFIGRWVVKELLDNGHEVGVLDDMSNGHLGNLSEFFGHPRLLEICIGDVVDQQVVAERFSRGYDVCLHLAARINVHESIENPRQTLNVDVVGTFNVLDEARRHGVKVVYVSTCLVYGTNSAGQPVTEDHPPVANSPYAAAKLGGEKLAEAFWHTYGMPTVVVRPFNTYGPFQKATGEGGVIPTFVGWNLAGIPLKVYGTGEQSRDFLYVSDCARLIVAAAFSDKANGLVIHGGSGRSTTINELARLVCADPRKIVHVEHIHPQCEIWNMAADNTKARRLLGWEPQVSLFEGIALTEVWIDRTNRQDGDSHPDVYSPQIVNRLQANPTMERKA